MNPKAKAPRKPDPVQPTQVYCAKCDHQNPGDVVSCEKCGAHLFITCHNCGFRNERAASRCDECGQRLHRSLLRKLRKKFRRGGRHFSFGQLVLLAIVVGMAFIVVKFLNDLKLPF